MAYLSRSYYPGNGTNRDFSVDFPYLDRTHIQVFVDGAITSAWTWTDPSHIRLTTAPMLNAVVLIKRQTSPNVRLVDYVSPSSLNEDDLDTDSLQGFYLAQEANDQASAGIADDPVTGQYTAGGKRVTNVADPVNAQDAVTKNYFDTIGAQIVANATAQAVTATTQAGIATTKAGDAGTAKAAADADVVLTHADVVLTHADVVSTGADRAAVAADKATVSTDKGLVAADKATVATNKGLVDTAKAAVDTQKGLIDGMKSAIDVIKSAIDTIKGQVDTAKAASDANAAQTAADRVQTSLDRTAAANSAAAAAASAGSLTPVEDQINNAPNGGFSTNDSIVARKVDGTLGKWSWGAARSNVLAFLGSWLSTTATAKTTPVDADLIVVGDSAASFASVKTTMTQLWANYLKPKADALYLTVATLPIAATSQYLSNVTGYLLRTDQIWGAAYPTNLGAPSGNITLDFATFVNASMAPTGNITFNAVANLKRGQSGVIWIYCASAYTLSLNTAIFFAPNGAGISIGQGRNVLSYYVDQEDKVHLFLAGRGMI